MADYDIAKAFRRIELELIASMKRNWEKHNADEEKEGFTWSRWQAEELRNLREYRKNNQTKFSSDFETINQSFINQITQQHDSRFFGINERRMNALVNSSVKDLKSAEVAMLRTTNDSYRKIIYDSQVYLNSGAGTLNKAIDMASDDFLKQGINCVVYKNGRRVNIADYAEMSLRTASTRATLYAGGARRNELGVHTVKVSSYGMCSPTCLPWQGKVYVDDVYSGGTAAEASKLNLPLLSEAIAGGLFHPNCKHMLTTYYLDGLQNNDEGNPRDNQAYENSPEDIQHQKYQLQMQQQKRIAAGSLDQSKIDKAQNAVNQLQAKDDQLNKANIADQYKDEIDNSWESISKIEKGKSKMEIDKLLSSFGMKTEYEIAKVPRILLDVDEDYQSSIYIYRQDIGYMLSRHQGQLTLSDFEKIPEVIENYDVCIKGNLDSEGDYVFYKIFLGSDNSEYGIEVKVRKWKKVERVVHMIRIGSRGNQAHKKLIKYLHNEKVIDFKK